MKNLTQKLFISAVFLGALTNAYADDDIQEMESIAKGLGLISLEEAKTKALAAKPGVVKDADLENRKFGKGWDYEFEIVDADGHEWEVNIDAKTGEVRGTSREWF
jgi:uncharacterized membrane protein YkoI